MNFFQALVSVPSERVIVSEVGAVVTDSIIHLVPHDHEDGPIRRLD